MYLGMSHRFQTPDPFFATSFAIPCRKYLDFHREIEGPVQAHSNPSGTHQNLDADSLVAWAQNDTVDQDFDRRVRRCRHRPVARGAVSTRQAHSFALAQLLLGLYPLLRWPGGPFPDACMPHAITSLALFAVYALLKRVTNYPQVFLGISFAWAVSFGIAMLGGDPLHEDLRTSTAALCGANLLWTVVYDTIYAHQDVADDPKAGVKGMAVRFRNTTKTLASGLSVAMVVLLAICGISARFKAPYFVGTVGGVAVAMAYFIWDVDLHRPESCSLWFHRQFWLVGLGFLSGFMAQFSGQSILKCLE